MKMIPNFSSLGHKTASQESTFQELDLIRVIINNRAIFKTAGNFRVQESVMGVSKGREVTNYTTIFYHHPPVKETTFCSSNTQW
jgi:hypothetical protein